mgnify:CR=1 FL=1
MARFRMKGRPMKEIGDHKVDLDQLPSNAVRVKHQFITRYAHNEQQKKSCPNCPNLLPSGQKYCSGKCEKEHTEFENFLDGLLK